MGFTASYFLADSWFGCKKNVKLALDNDLIAIFMMKRGISKYRLNGELYTLKGLYRKFRKNMVKLRGKSFHACTINVDYNLSDDPKNPEWRSVQLVFSRMKSAPKSSWVVLLCSDPEMELGEILEVYALRWNIEVYFKEVKQYFGFMKEQSWQYTVRCASIHLAMIRYTLFYYLSLMNSSASFSELRNGISMNMMIFSYGIIAWQTISQIIADTMKDCSDKLGKDVADSIHASIEHQVHRYFESIFPLALGITVNEIAKLDRAEKLGEL